MKIIRYLTLTFFAVLGYFILQAQNNKDIPAVNALRVSGKIYVVVLVLLTVLMGILFYLTILDGKQKKLEKEIKKP